MSAFILEYAKLLGIILAFLFCIIICLIVLICTIAFLYAIFTGGYQYLAAQIKVISNLK